MGDIILGTAGHVDHGKTEIIKALTGRDTDRLREEKERGISIVLGFAPLYLDEEVVAGVVDVPGHEKFVRNMVSGATGVDIALMVVAADEGVMPQTVEHFEVIKLLGIDSVIFAISKMDLVDDDTADIVESELADMMEGTVMEGAPVVRVSPVTGQGIRELRARLAEMVAGLKGRKESDIFRLPVDRVFTRKGVGTIVTGTAWSGEVKEGDQLVLHPAGREVRVRGVQKFDRSLKRATAGMRTALSLKGVNKGGVSTGDQLVTPGSLEATGMIDAVVKGGRLCGGGLKNRQRIRFHHASGEIMSRLVLLDRERIEPDRSGMVQLRLEKPTVARGGDRFILRTYSPMRVVGGGIVLDPNPGKARRFREERLEFLNAIREGGWKEKVIAVSSRSGGEGITGADLVRFGFAGQEMEGVVDELSQEGKVVIIGERILAAGVLEKLEERINEILKDFQKNNKLIWGMDLEELKEKLGGGSEGVVDYLIKGGKGSRYYLKGGMVRVGSGERELAAEDRRILEVLMGRIEKNGYKFSDIRELEQLAGENRDAGLYLHILQEKGLVSRVGGEEYIGSKRMEGIVSWLRKKLFPDGEITIGDFKEEFDLSRKYAVPLLEYLDGEGYTRREGNVRVAGSRLNEDG